MRGETVFSNARLVLPGQTIRGSMAVGAGKIRSIDEAKARPFRGIDCRGDFLLPGLIELHTDNLEKHVSPRPGISWPAPVASVIAHDNQVTGSGITTVLDGVAMGFDDAAETRHHILDKSIDAIACAVRNGLLRADHYLHLRCELPGETAYESFERYAVHPLVKLVSVMDHTPGQRQWSDLRKWRLFHRDKRWSDADARAVINQRKELARVYASANRSRIVAAALGKGLPVASHDDTVAAHCREAHALGIGICEFPTTAEAAEEARRLGMTVVMGAPNMVRGESHSGNVSARGVAEAGLLDGFSSDYMPISLLHAAFELRRLLHLPLHRAVATVTTNIAAMLRLVDRGALETGKKADIIRVRLVGGLPVVREVWKNGNQVLCSSRPA